MYKELAIKKYTDNDKIESFTKLGFTVKSEFVVMCSDFFDIQIGDTFFLQDKKTKVIVADIKSLGKYNAILCFERF